mgnify:CR=1 FL=1
MRNKLRTSVKAARAWDAKHPAPYWLWLAVHVTAWLWVALVAGASFGLTILLLLCAEC